MMPLETKLRPVLPQGSPGAPSFFAGLAATALTPVVFFSVVGVFILILNERRDLSHGMPELWILLSFS